VPVIRVRHLSATAALIAGLVAGLLAVASPASASVLVHQPSLNVCIGSSIDIGVWYQSYSGGSRHYVVNVKAPNGRRIFHREGRAPSAQWKYWYVPTHQTGAHVVVYRVHGRRLRYVSNVVSPCEG
jgi:hypothetical protein